MSHTAPEPSTSYTTEFAVDMTCAACEKKVKEALAHVIGTESVTIDVPSKRVVIQGYAKTSVLLAALRTTGLRTAVQGQGRESAVCVLQGDAGLARFVPLDAQRLWMELSVNPAGFVPGTYRVTVQETGDLSADDMGATLKTLGDLHLPETSTLYTECDSALAPWIGRGLCLLSPSQRTCGVIARSAGAFQNDKKICTCSGKTIWEDGVQL